MQPNLLAVSTGALRGGRSRWWSHMGVRKGLDESVLWLVGSSSLGAALT